MEKTDSIGEWRRVFAILLSVGSVLFTIPWLAVSALALWQVNAGVFEGGELVMAAIFLTAPPVGLFTFLALLLVGPARCKVAWLSALCYVLFPVVACLALAVK